MGIATAASSMKFALFNEINYRLLCDANKSAFSLASLVRSFRMHKRKATMLKRGGLRGFELFVGLDI